MVRIVFSFLLSLLFASTIVSAQSGHKTARPKIGLALSGGSAHGFAHLGVLKYMEELGIEVDYITGTSMGSVIGGLYAMGFDASEIEYIAGSLDWDMIMSNEIPLTDVAPIEKPFHGKLPLSVLWKDNTFKLPQGIFRGQKLDLVVNKVYSPALMVDHFDHLHIPFRCVAVDIEDGSIDVFEDGYIGDAIRASMSIPTVFPPKEIDGTLYVDGGLFRNFPVQEVKDMGAEIVIGVYVGSEKKERNQLHSMLDIMRQSASMAGIMDSDRQKEMVDILVVPDVKDISTFDFNKYEQNIEKGYDAAKAQADAFRALAKRLSHFPPPKRYEKLTYPESLRFDQICTKDCEHVFDEMILNKLKIWEGYAVTLEEVDQSLSLLYGTKNFSKTAYNFHQHGDTLQLEIDAEAVAPYSLGFNVNRFRNYNTAFLISAEARNVLGRPSNLHLDGRLSDNPGVQATYYLRAPSVPSILVSLSGKFERSEMPIYNGGDVLRTFDLDQAYVKLELNNEWKNRFLLRVGYANRRDKIKPQNIDNTDLTGYKSQRHEVFIGLDHNDLNRRPYPSSGQDYGISVSYILDNEISQENLEMMNMISFLEDRQYLITRARFTRYTSLSDRLCLKTSARGRVGIGRNFLDHYQIGGPSQTKHDVYGFIGVDDGALLVGDHISGELSLRYQLNTILYVSPTVQYLYGESYRLNGHSTMHVGGVGLALDYDSPIGPVSLSIGYSDQKDELDMNFGLGYRHIF